MKMPTNITPMAATLANEPFDDIHWCFELKLDGYRILAYIDKGNVKLQTRNLKDYTGKFTQITSALQKWKRSAIIDGEVVMLNDKGHSDFNALQNWKSDYDGPLYFFVFDLLWLDGKDYMKEPLSRRKTVLKSILPKSPVVIYQSELWTHGIAAFNMAKSEGLEGVIAKRVDSIYRPGIRSKDWLKLKVYREEGFVICGYTKGEKSGTLFGTLILGAVFSGTLTFVGEVGTGFSEKVKEEILKKIKPEKKSPFIKEVVLSGRWRKKKPEIVVWCRPDLFCSVKYLEFTAEGVLRHPSFIRLLESKKVK